MQKFYFKTHCKNAHRYRCLDEHGYRFQKPTGKLLFRIGFTPFMEYQNEIDIHPSGGIAIGYSF